MLAAAAAIVVFLLRSRAGRRPAGEVRLPASGHRNLGYLPGIKPVSPLSKRCIPHPVQKSGVLPPPKTASVIDGMSDITESLGGLVEKYSLEHFTIATIDGLVFASSGGKSAEEDAARFGGFATAGFHTEPGGIVRFGLTHKGSDLVGIIRTNLQIPAEISRMIERDTQDILNWWI